MDLVEPADEVCAPSIVQCVPFHQLREVSHAPARGTRRCGEAIFLLREAANRPREVANGPLGVANVPHGVKILARGHANLPREATIGRRGPANVTRERAILSRAVAILMRGEKIGPHDAAILTRGPAIVLHDATIGALFGRRRGAETSAMTALADSYREQTTDRRAYTPLVALLQEMKRQVFDFHPWNIAH